MDKLISGAYYWIKVMENQEWEPAQHINYCPDECSGYFYITGSENQYYENEVFEIGEMLLKPAEPKAKKPLPYIPSENIIMKNH